MENTQVSVRKELREYAEKNRELRSDYSRFDVTDMMLLNSDSTDTPEYKFALQKYNLYLHAALEDFERGPHGLKNNLDKDRRLKVLNEEDSNRMLLLARDYTRKLLQKSDYDEFHILYEKYEIALRKLAIQAQERGLVCWILQNKEQNQTEQYRVYHGFGLRHRAPFEHK